MINLERALGHPFQDKDWVTKMLIGAGVSLVPVLNFALNGYALDVLRNTARGQYLPLPRWDDLGRQFVEGAKLFIVQLIYSIPILALVFVLMLMGLGFYAGTENASRGAREALNSGFAVVSIVFTCVAFLYGLALAFLTPAMYVLVARTGSIGAAFRPSDITALFRRRTGDYLLVAVLPIILGAVLAMVFIVLTLIPFVGLCLVLPLMVLIFLLTPYFYIVSGHLYGQLEQA